MMKKLLTILSLVFSSVVSQAQETNVMKELEKPDSLYSSVVTVNNIANIDLLPSADKDILAYSIRLYFDNAQYSRTIAYKIKKRFSAQFPSVPVKVSYKAPYFMVTAGLYLSHIEATSFLKSIEEQFKNSFIIPANVPISSFKQVVIVEQVDSLPKDTLLLLSN